MTREKLSLSRERDFVTNLITSDKFCNSVLPFMNVTYFDSDYTRIVAQWILDYYKEYFESPKTNILAIYRNRCQEIEDKPLQSNVLTYLRKIVENYDEAKPNNEGYAIDQGLQFLKEKSLRNYSEDIQACLATGDIDKADQLRNSYREIVIDTDDELDFFNSDAELVYSKLTESQEEILFLPEAFEKVFGKLHRNDFVAIGAKAKGGKTWCLIWLGLTALTQHLKVVHFSLEMTTGETASRYWKMAFGMKSGLVEKGKKFKSSRFVKVEGFDEEDPEYDVEEYEVMVDKEYNIEVEEKRKMFAKYCHGGNLRIVSYPMNQATVSKLKNKCDNFIQDGFVPDVVIIDYADILKLSGNGELRNQLDLTWKELRGWARENHILLITASQLNRGSFGKGHVQADQIAEDIRKLGHVTSMVALDQTPAMKKKHISALTPFVTRSDEAVDTCVFCQNLGLGQFVNGKAHLMNEVNFSDDEED